MSAGLRRLVHRHAPRKAQANTLTIRSLRPIKAPHKGILIRIRCVALFVVLAFANLPSTALAQSSSCTSIEVKVLNISNSVGTIGCVLFESADGFPIEYLRYATNIIPRFLPPVSSTTGEPWI
jgi:hypothetical protein